MSSQDPPDSGRRGRCWIDRHRKLGDPKSLPTVDEDQAWKKGEAGPGIINLGADLILNFRQRASERETQRSQSSSTLLALG